MTAGAPIRRGLSPAFRAHQDGALLDAVCRGDLGGARRALLSGADPDAAEPSRQTCALTFAALAGRIELMRLLIRHGAGLERPNIAGSTPLMLASHADAADSVRLLLESGARLEARNDSGCTALVFAAEAGAAAAAAALVAAGAARADAPEADGLTACQLALRDYLGDAAQAMTIDAVARDAQLATSAEPVAAADPADILAEPPSPASTPAGDAILPALEAALGDATMAGRVLKIIQLHAALPA